MNSEGLESKRSAKSRRGPLLAAGALLCAAGALAFIAFGRLGDNLIYYWSPSEMLAHGASAYGPTIRLGGLVKPGSMHWSPSHAELRFVLVDGESASAASIDVLTSKTPPQMFREGIGVVVEGTFDISKTFRTERLMVNHGNEYRPPRNDAEFKDMLKRAGNPEAMR